MKLFDFIEMEIEWNENYKFAFGSCFDFTSLVYLTRAQLHMYWNF